MCHNSPKGMYESWHNETLSLSLQVKHYISFITHVVCCILCLLSADTHLYVDHFSREFVILEPIVL